jgi:hypothetical protein
MTDIFLSYSHIDRERVRPIVELLVDEGWSVWWDRGIEPGMKWLPNLEVGLRNCKAVVVAWSETSIKSNWVHREAEAGISKGSLVPILLDKGRIPRKFSKYQALDLSSWKGEVDRTEIQTLLRRLAELVPPSRIDTVRPGYKTKFLGSKNEIRLPSVSGSAAVLRYNHFTVAPHSSFEIVLEASPWAHLDIYASVAPDCCKYPWPYVSYGKVLMFISWHATDEHIH